MKNQFSVWRGWYGRFLPKEKSARILDVGCGHGGILYWLQNSGFENTEGVDINREKIDMGVGLKVKNLHHGDALSFLRDKKSVYDRVFLIDVLDSMTKEEAMDILETILTSLKEGGLVITRSSNAESPAGRLRYERFGEKADLTEQSVKNALSLAGFKSVGAYPVRPVIHGVKSLIRHCFWRLIEVFLKLYRLIEIGSPSGIFTQNIIAVGEKRG